MGNPVTIFEEIGPIFNLKKQDGTFGIEIETSAKQEYIVPQPSGWKVHGDDHSIRDFGREYVLKSPQKIEKIPHFLEKFKEATKDIKFEDHPSTSVHVHINMAAETFLTMANFIVLYVMFEPLLHRFCGELRSNSLFAVSARKSEIMTPFFCRMLSSIAAGDISPIKELNIHNEKYASLNLVPIKTFGSVEVRCLEGTTDIKRINLWIEILNSLLVKAKTEELTPPKIVQKFIKDREEFVISLFGKNFKALFFNGWKEEIDRNLWYVYQIARSVPNWEMINGVIYSAFKDTVKYVEKPKLKANFDPHMWVIHDELPQEFAEALPIIDQFNF